MSIEEDYEPIVSTHSALEGQVGRVKPLLLTAAEHMEEDAARLRAAARMLTLNEDGEPEQALYTEQPRIDPKRLAYLEQALAFYDILMDCGLEDWSGWGEAVGRMKLRLRQAEHNSEERIAARGGKRDILLRAQEEGRS